VTLHGHCKGEGEQQPEQAEHRTLDAADLALARLIVRDMQAQAEPEAELGEGEEQERCDREDGPLISEDAEDESVHLFAHGGPS
jgi:hypothetical protein